MSNPYEILVEYGAFNQIKVTISRDGIRLSPFSSNLPSALRQLGRHAGAYQSIEEELVRALDNVTVPIRLRIMGNSPVLADWNPEATYELRWELNLESQSVELRQGAINHLGNACVVNPVGKRLVVDVSRQQVGRVIASDDRATVPDLEAAFRKIRSSQSRGAAKGAVSEEFHLVKVETYNAVPVGFESEEILRQIQFCEAGVPINPVINTPLYFLNISPDPSDAARCLVQSGLLFGTDTILLSELWSPIVETLVDLPGAISSQNWRRMISDVIWWAIDSEQFDIDVLEKKIEDSAKSGLPPQILAAKELVRTWLSYRDSPEVVAFAGERWWFARHDWLQQSVAVIACFTAIDGVHYEDGLITVPADLIHVVAEKIEQRISKFGIQLRWNETPLKFESWEIEAELFSDGDRYVVDPIIRFQGSQVRLESWDSILSSNGFQVSDTHATLLSSETVEAIRALLRYQPKGTGSEGANANRIVLGGRLRILDVLYLTRSGVRIRLSDEDAKLISALQNFGSLERIPLPDGFSGDLREYQRAGFDWLVFLYKHRFGACLADDMGLGKTIQAIVFLSWVTLQPHRTHVSLVVVPPSLVYNWRQEVSRFAPQLRVREYTGTGRTLILEDTDIVITTYDIVRRDIDLMAETQFGVVVFDEAQVIKNMMASRSAAVRRLKGEFKICLTGTPLENHAGEFVSILELAVPGLTDGIADHRGKPGGAGELIARARPFVLRRTKEKILKELPEKIESTVYLPLSGTQSACYQKVVVEVREQIKQMFEKYKSGQAGLLAITALLRLRQLCITPQLIDPDYAGTSPKIDFLAEKLLEVQEEGHSALVFTQFRSFANILRPVLEKNGVNLIQIDGNTRMSDRKKLIEKFQNSETPMVALMTLKTGGVGLNLVKASYVFHVDPWWNPAAENQASDRAHRIGQTQKVNVIRLIMQESIEEKVLTLKAGKQLLFDEIVNSGLSRDKANTLSRDDFKFLLD